MTTDQLRQQLKAHQMNCSTAIKSILLALLVSVAAPVWAQLTEDQASALRLQAESGDKAALDTLLSEGEVGDAIAQYQLGNLYRIGKGVKQDIFAAQQWYLRAAEQGNASAQYNLGLFYTTASARWQARVDLAAKWLRAAADQGHAGAQVRLGLLYRYGKTISYSPDAVPQDFEQMLYWFRKAADQGSAIGQYNLGVAYADGMGVKPSFTEAAQWYARAASSGYAPAYSSLAELYQRGRGVPRNKVVAYALYSNAMAADTGADRTRASGELSAFAAGLNATELQAGKTLSEQMNTSGDVQKTLNEYLAGSAAVR
jgi:TPR repeat protein